MSKTNNSKKMENGSPLSKNENSLHHFWKYPQFFPFAFGKYLPMILGK